MDVRLQGINKSFGKVSILKDVDLDLSGGDVVVVEDMVDTGLTANYLCRQLAERGPRRLDMCTLLDRPVRRIVPLEVRYRGAEIPDVFVLGYGLHLAELYRNLDEIYDADRRVVQADPGAYVEANESESSAADRSPWWWPAWVQVVWEAFCQRVSFPTRIRGSSSSIYSCRRRPRCREPTR